MPRRMLKLLCAMLAITVVLCALSPALAAGPWTKSGKTREGYEGTEYYVYTYNLNVFEKPSKKSEVVEIVPFAKRILFLDELKGWAKVYTTNGRLGYCNYKQLTAEDPNIYNTTVYCQQNRAPVYLRPSQDAPLMGHLDRDEKTTLVAITPKHDWMRIQAGKYYGYIQRPRIDYMKYENNEGKDAWINVQSVDVYYDTDIESTFNTSFFGQHVRVVDTDAGWAKIRSDSGLIGFVNPVVLTDTDPNSLDIPVYTQIEGSYMYRSAADLSGSRHIDANVKLMLSSVDEDLHWARVRYHDDYYYVPYVFLSTEKRTGDSKKVKAKSALSIYDDSGVLTNVPAGTDLNLVGYSENRARVSTIPDANGNRFTGYVEITDIM